jgi:putative flippase GtrA
VSLLARLLRFALVGVVCFIVQWCMVRLLRTTINPFWADMVAFACSAQLNFMLSKSITWRDNDHESSAVLAVWIRYNAVAVCAAIANAGVFVLFDHLTGATVALLLATCASAVFSFGLNHLFVFRSEESVMSVDVNLTKAAEDGIAIFFPAYNEAENLPNVLIDAVDYFRTLRVPFKLIVVNDGSPDNTIEVMGVLSTVYPEIQLVNHPENRGYGAALRTGFKATLETEYAWIGFSDADGQFDVRDFGKLIERAVVADAEACIGFRIARADGLKRRLMGRGWHVLSALVLGYRASDVDCGFKLFRRPAMAELEPQLVGDHATISPELLARAARADHQVVEVGVKHYPRQNGEQTGANLSVVIASLRQLFAVRRTLRRKSAPVLVEV